MTNTKGSLNIKDYPFAFSVAALIFPPLLNSGNEIPVILGITIVGGILGSILTIINPFGLIIRGIYIIFGGKHVYGFLRYRPITDTITEKNFRSSIPSPSISYETDKMVGMIYFIMVMSFAIYRFNSPEFIQMINFSLTQIYIVISGLVVGMVGVCIVLYFDIIGFNRFGFNSPSHLNRIESVTALNLASDFTNLSDIGTKYCELMKNHTSVICAVCAELNRLDRKGIRGWAEFYNEFDKKSIRQNYEILGYNIKLETEEQIMPFFDFYGEIQQMSSRYNIIFYQTIVWFLHPVFFKSGELDSEISLLQSSVDSRDWINASLKSVRIINKINYILNAKNMPEEFLSNIS